MTYSDYHLVARLFLLELDGPTRDALEGDPRFAPILPDGLQEARVEFTRLFAMSVYPYGSVYLGDKPEMNGESTASVERFYGSVGFELASTWMFGAADALGAELECVAQLLKRGEERRAQEFLRDHVMPWAPVCCFAIERNARLELYRMLGQVTCDLLLNEGDGLEGIAKESDDSTEPGPEERDLHWVVDHLIAPHRCGIFLSKSELSEIGRQVQVPISFGDRGLMLESLLRGAGGQERAAEALEGLQLLVRQWIEVYSRWTAKHPRMAGLWGRWQTRAQATEMMLTGMKEAALRLGIEEA